MLGLLLAGGGKGVVEETLSEITPVATATPTVMVYDGVIKTGFSWGIIAYYAVGILFVLLLAYIIYNIVKGAKAKVKK